MNEVIIKNSLVDFPRLEQIKKYVNQTNPLSGDCAEVGVFTGGTAYLICENTQKRVYLFDTFEGLPEVTQGIDLHHKGDFTSSIAHLTNVLRPFNNYMILKGIFPRDNRAIVENKKFAFVHLDVDIYPSTKECLEFFYPRMVQGGVIVMDDYNLGSCPGVPKAFDEFMADKPEKEFVDVQGQRSFVKL